MEQPYCDLGNENYFEQQEQCFDRAYDKLVNGSWGILMRKEDFLKQL